MTKRLFALLLAIAMIVTVFAGCKKAPADSSDNVSVIYQTEYEYVDEGTGSSVENDSNNSSSGKKPASSGNKDNNSAPVVGENSNTNKTGFPIVKKKETITVMTNMMNASSFNYEETEFTKEYEKMTNMDIVWRVVTESQLKSQVSLALQSGNLPDIMFADLDDEDVLRYGAEGSFVEITKELLKEWAPNIYAAYNENPEAWKNTVTSDGKMWTIASFSKDYNYAQHYFWVRTTWLKNLGLSKPKTMDQFYEMLKAFKNNDPNGNGTHDEIPFATWHHGGFLFNPWGFTSTIDVTTTGTVTNMYTTKNMKDAVTYWAKVYKEGLVDKGSIDNYTGGAMVPLRTLIKQGKVGCFFMGFPGEDTAILKEYEILPYPTAGNNGDFPSVAINVNPVSDNGHVYITKKCKNVTAALRWLDYLYTDEGYMLRHYGTEGGYYKKTSDTTYELTGTPASAQPAYTIRGKDYLSKYTITNAEENKKSYVISQRAVMDDWCGTTLKTNKQKFLPTAWMTQSEIDAKNRYRTYWSQVSEMWWQFIQGKKNMGSDWTTLINEMNSKNMNKYIAELQKYYDRCN